MSAFDFCPIFPAPKGSVCSRMIMGWTRNCDILGLLLSTIVTKLNNMTCAKVSPCGRFIAASGKRTNKLTFLSVDLISLFGAGAGKEVKVWHVTFDKSSGEFQSVEGAFELTGHSDDIPVFSFSGDSTRMVSVSVDKTFRLYDINVDFKKKQDPPLLTASSWTKETVFPQRLHVALSNDSRCLIIASTSDILIISGLDGKLLCRIDQAFAGRFLTIIFTSINDTGPVPSLSS